MLRAELKHEWVASLSVEDIVQFNKPQNSELFLRNVDLPRLGGYAMIPYKSQGTTFYSGDDTAVVMGRAPQEFWRQHAALDLAFGQPAIMGSPNHDLAFQRADGVPNFTAIEQMERFLLKVSEHTMLLGYERVLLPYAGVTISEFHYSPSQPLPENVQVLQAMTGSD